MTGSRQAQFDGWSQILAGQSSATPEAVVDFPFARPASPARALKPSQTQAEFTFDGTGENGLRAWREWREAELSALARRAGLPIGHEVEVWLRGGIRLRGKLRFREHRLFLDDEQFDKMVLEIGGVSFSASEIESCVRMD